MGKKSTGKHYVSKGERPSVNKKVLNKIRKMRSWSAARDKASRDFRNNIIHRARRSSDKEINRLAEKFKQEAAVESMALDLFDKYGSYGCTWAACIQAVKTDHVPQLKDKWHKQANS